MSYEFHALYSTDTAFNCDVKKSGDEEYMGRLYVFPTEDPALLKLGIEKEWFLAHESGDCVVCGHINTKGQWCLSPYQSLEPSLEYTTQIEVLNRVFSPQYMEEVLVRRSSEQSLETFEYVAPPANGAGGGDASDGGQPARFDPRLMTLTSYTRFLLGDTFFLWLLANCPQLGIFNSMMRIFQKCY